MFMVSCHGEYDEIPLNFQATYGYLVFGSTVMKLRKPCGRTLWASDFTMCPGAISVGSAIFQYHCLKIENGVPSGKLT